MQSILNFINARAIYRFLYTDSTINNHFTDFFHLFFLWLRVELYKILCKVFISHLLFLPQL